MTTGPGKLKVDGVVVGGVTEVTLTFSTMEVCMKTEKRLKLLRDWATSTQEIRAGIIGTYLPRAAAWRFFDGREPSELVLADVIVKTGKEGWFAFVDVCLECEREVCVYATGYRTDHPAHHVPPDDRLCHGHGHEPELRPCPFCGGAAVIGSNSDGRLVICVACGADYGAGSNLAANIAAWNRRVK